jgi:hypothetical protein
MGQLDGSHEQVPEKVDISQKFLTLDGSDFNDYLRAMRNVPLLHIEVDISNMPNDAMFISKMRILKAFLEYKPRQQERTVKVTGRPEQRSWEPNVFSSGVEFENKE